MMRTEKQEADNYFDLAGEFCHRTMKAEAECVRLREERDALISMLKECLRDYGHVGFTDRGGMADRIRALLRHVGGQS